MNTRENWIDSAKGLAIILVVLGHAALGLILTGRNTYGINFLNVTMNIIYTFHMPLFFSLSGYLYGLTSRNSGLSNYRVFAIKKLVSIGIPYIIFSIIQCILSISASNIIRAPLSIRDIFQIPFIPIQHLWFLYALLVVFLFIGVIEVLIKNKFYIMAFLVTLNIITWFWHSDIYLINAIMTDSLFFYFGRMLLNYQIILNKKITILIALFALVIMIVLHFVLLTPLLSQGLFLVGNPLTIFLATITAITGSLVYSNLKVPQDSH